MIDITPRLIERSNKRSKETFFNINIVLILFEAYFRKFYLNIKAVTNFVYGF